MAEHDLEAQGGFRSTSAALSRLDGQATSDPDRSPTHVWVVLERLQRGPHGEEVRALAVFGAIADALRYVTAGTRSMYVTTVPLDPLGPEPSDASAALSRDATLPADPAIDGQ